MKITSTTRYGYHTSVEFRVAVQRNKRGRLRWVVQRSDFKERSYRGYVRVWETLSTHSSEAKAIRKLERVRGHHDENTWSTVEEDS